MRACSLLLLLTGCGTLSSGASAPTNEPTSGLGAATPITDSTGLSWQAPFILDDPSRDFTHPSVLVDGGALDVYTQTTVQGTTFIAHAHATSYKKGFGDTDTVLQATQAWEAGAVESPAVVRGSATLLFYVAGGRVGVARLDDGTRSMTPLYAAPEPITSIAAALDGETVHIVALVEGRVDELTAPVASILASLSGGTATFTTQTNVVAVPSWAETLKSVGLRIDKTAVGRVREDIFFGASVPVTTAGDLGANVPTAIGAASRYLDEPGPFETVDAPILSGPPYPGDPTAVGYEGGVLIFFAQESTRSAIAVAK